MSAPDMGGRAFPASGRMEQSPFNHVPHWNPGAEGMYLRDYFAAKALQGLLSEAFAPGCDATASVILGGGVNHQSETADHYAKAAYVLADSMLKARAS